MRRTRSRPRNWSNSARTSGSKGRRNERENEGGRHATSFEGWGWLSAHVSLEIRENPGARGARWEKGVAHGCQDRINTGIQPRYRTLRVYIDRG